MENSSLDPPVNYLLLLKQRMIKVELLLEKHAALTQKYNDLEKSHMQTVENEKKAKIDAADYLEKYCKLTQKCSSFQSKIKSLQDALNEKDKQLKNYQDVIANQESLIQAYKNERQSCDTYFQDKNFLLKFIWKLFKEGNVIKNKRKIEFISSKFQKDLDYLGLGPITFKKKASVKKEEEIPSDTTELQAVSSVESGFVDSDPPESVQYTSSCNDDLVCDEFSSSVINENNSNGEILEMTTEKPIDGEVGNKCPNVHDIRINHNYGGMNSFWKSNRLFEYENDSNDSLSLQNETNPSNYVQTDCGLENCESEVDNITRNKWSSTIRKYTSKKKCPPSFCAHPQVDVQYNTSEIDYSGYSVEDVTLPFDIIDCAYTQKYNTEKEESIGNENYPSLFTVVYSNDKNDMPNITETKTESIFDVADRNKSNGDTQEKFSTVEDLDFGIGNDIQRSSLVNNVKENDKLKTVIVDSDKKSGNFNGVPNTGCSDKSVDEIPDNEVLRILQNVPKFRLISPIKEVDNKLKNNKLKGAVLNPKRAKLDARLMESCSNTQNVNGNSAIEPNVSIPNVKVPASFLDKSVQTDENFFDITNDYEENKKRFKNKTVQSISKKLINQICKRMWDKRLEEKLENLNKISKFCKSESYFINFMKTLIKFLNMHCLNNNTMDNGQTKKKKINLGKNNVKREKASWKVEDVAVPVSDLVAVQKGVDLVDNVDQLFRTSYLDESRLEGKALEWCISGREFKFSVQDSGKYVRNMEVSSVSPKIDIDIPLCIVDELKQEDDSVENSCCMFSPSVKTNVEKTANVTVRRSARIKNRKSVLKCTSEKISGNVNHIKVKDVEKLKKSFDNVCVSDNNVDVEIAKSEKRSDCVGDKSVNDKVRDEVETLKKNSEFVKDQCVNDIKDCHQMEKSLYNISDNNVNEVVTSKEGSDNFSDVCCMTINNKDGDEVEKWNGDGNAMVKPSPLPELAPESLTIKLESLFGDINCDYESDSQNNTTTRKPKQKELDVGNTDEVIPQKRSRLACRLRQLRNVKKWTKKPLVMDLVPSEEETDRIEQHETGSPPLDDSGFLDSILSAMTRQSEEFKPKSFVRIREVHNGQAVDAAQVQVPEQANSISNVVEGDDGLYTTKSDCGNSGGVCERKSIGNRQEERDNKLVQRDLNSFLTADLNSAEEAEEQINLCVARIEKASENVVARAIVAEVMTNVDEEIQNLPRPAPPLTRTQHRLITLLTVLPGVNPKFSNLHDSILKIIWSKLFPENFFWPDDSLETSSRFYAAVCRKQNDFKGLWKFCFKVITTMKQRWCIPILVVLQVWPDILHDASDAHENVLVNAFVNIILYTPKEEENRRKKQIEKICVIKNLLRQFFHFNVDSPIEEFTTKIFETLSQGCHTQGHVDALILLAKCRPWTWTRKHIVEKLVEMVENWSTGILSETVVLKVLDILKATTFLFPVPDQTVPRLMALLIKLVEADNEFVKQKAVKALCGLKCHAGVQDALRPFLNNFTGPIRLAIQQALVPLSKASGSQKNTKKVILKNRKFTKKKKKSKKKKKKACMKKKSANCSGSPAVN